MSTCCQCPEPPGYDPEVDAPLPKYRNKCGCPTATVICESVEKTATLCGFSEFGTATSPPKKYKVLSLSGSESISGEIFDPTCTNQDLLKDWTATATGGGDVTYDTADCTKSGTLTSSCTTNYTDCGNGSSPSYNGTNDLSEAQWPRATRMTSDSACSIYSGGGSTPNKTTSVLTTANGQFTKTLTSKDTEADALARATETSGELCTSIYELRTTSFSLTVRTVKFSLELTNLCYGRAYEGCVRIRKRKAFSGTIPDGEVIEWEDVEPFTFGPITPTAANTTDGITTTAEITDQDLVGGTEEAIGWEYEIVSAHVWPVSAGCDCPTELGYKDPE